MRIPRPQQRERFLCGLAKREDMTARGFAACSSSWWTMYRADVSAAVRCGPSLSLAAGCEREVDGL